MTGLRDGLAFGQQESYPISRDQNRILAGANSQCSLRSSDSEAIDLPQLRAYAYEREMCSDDDRCMLCEIDEIGWIANSNHATKTRLDHQSAPVVLEENPEVVYISHLYPLPYVESRQ